MKMISKRLLTILKMINKTETIADIGTDHCIIPLSIIDNNLAKLVIATDINRSIIDKLSKKITGTKYDGKIDLRCGKGLETVKRDEANIIIITGMGCETILEILEDINNYVFDYLLISPQTKLYDFRKYIINNKMNILDEKIIEENGKYYFIFKICKSDTKVNYKEYEYMFSKILVLEKSKLLKKYILNKINQYENIVKIKDLEEIKNKIDLSYKCLKKMEE